VPFGRWCGGYRRGGRGIKGLFEDLDKSGASHGMGPSHAGHDGKNGVEVFDVEGDFCARFDLIEVEMTPRKEGSLFVLEHHAVAVGATDDGACFVDGTSALFEERAKFLRASFVSGKPRLKALLGGWV